MHQKQQLNHFFLFIYSFKNLSQRQKVKFIRALFGYKNVKGDKVYVHQGLIQMSQSIKLSQNVLLVPEQNAVLFKNFFSSNNIKAEVKEVWLKQ